MHTSPLQPAFDLLCKHLNDALQEIPSPYSPQQRTHDLETLKTLLSLHHALLLLQQSFVHYKNIEPFLSHIEMKHSSGNAMLIDLKYSANSGQAAATFLKHAYENRNVRLQKSNAQEESQNNTPSPQLLPEDFPERSKIAITWSPSQKSHPLLLQETSSSLTGSFAQAAPIFKEGSALRNTLLSIAHRSTLDSTPVLGTKTLQFPLLSPSWHSFLYNFCAPSFLSQLEYYGLCSILPPASLVRPKNTL